MSLKELVSPLQLFYIPASSGSTSSLSGLLLINKFDSVFVMLFQKKKN